MEFADKFNLDPNAVNKAYNTCEDYLKLLGLEDKVGDIEKKVTDTIKLDEGIASWNAIAGTIIQYIYMAADDIICGMYPKMANNIHSDVNYNDMSKNVFSISGPEYDMATTLVACTIDDEQIDREAIRRFINSGAVEELPIWAGDFINMKGHLALRSHNHNRQVYP